jgi:hypothetical protein
MSKFKTMVLMLCLVLSAALSYAHGVARTETERDGTSIITIAKIQHGGIDKSGSIMPTLNGHYLTVAFTENLGQVDIEITTATGGYVQAISCLTPNGLMFYIPNTGDYIVTFTLPNGDEYYGEFTITD